MGKHSHVSHCCSPSLTHESQTHRSVHVQPVTCSNIGWFRCNLSYMSPQHRTLSECVDGVTGWQVGAGDKVFTRGRLYLHSRPALQVAVETAHLPGWEGDVGDTAFIAVPWRTVKKEVIYPTRASAEDAVGQISATSWRHVCILLALSPPILFTNTCQLWFTCVITQLWKTHGGGE